MSTKLDNIFTYFSLVFKLLSMNIVILCPRSEFTASQVNKLHRLGKITFTPNRNPIQPKTLTELVQSADILGLDVDNLGGFEAAPDILRQVLPSAANLKAIALASTSFGYLDQAYCRDHHIRLTHVPGYSTESVAEQALAYMLLSSKRIVESDRLTQADKYSLLMGHNLQGKTLGIIGLGQIGTRVSELGQALGMPVLAWNRTPKSLPGIASVSLEQVLCQSDFLSLHLAKNQQTQNFLNRKLLRLLKPGVIVINVSNRYLVDETAIASPLKSGRISHYVFEAENLSRSSPLSGLPNALAFKGFGWYTRESLDANKRIWVDNILGLASGHPPNPVPVSGL
jgi:phosphoglycerate dehydrogenase-like enzyme